MVLNFVFGIIKGKKTAMKKTMTQNYVKNILKNNCYQK